MTKTKVQEFCFEVECVVEGGEKGSKWSNVHCNTDRKNKIAFPLRSWKSEEYVDFKITL